MVSYLVASCELTVSVVRPKRQVTLRSRDKLEQEASYIKAKR